MLKQIKSNMEWVGRDFLALSGAVEVIPFCELVLIITMLTILEFFFLPMVIGYRISELIDGVDYDEDT